MVWRPLSRDQLQGAIARELAECSDEQRAYFKRVAFEPTKWSQSPYGDEGGGFWAVAADDNRVLWYNDIGGRFQRVYVLPCARRSRAPSVRPRTVLRASPSSR